MSGWDGVVRSGYYQRSRAAGRHRRPDDVAAGHTKRQIATALWLSPHTVSDHLKKVFAKLDVANRAELTARLFFDHYLPRQTAQIPLGGDGWYIDQD